eukprot:s708_g38.t1
MQRDRVLDPIRQQALRCMDLLKPQSLESLKHFCAPTRNLRDDDDDGIPHRPINVNDVPPVGVMAMMDVIAISSGEEVLQFWPRLTGFPTDPASYRELQMDVQRVFRMVKEECTLHTVEFKKITADGTSQLWVKETNGQGATTGTKLGGLPMSGDDIMASMRSLEISPGVLCLSNALLVLLCMDYALSFLMLIYCVVYGAIQPIAKVNPHLLQHRLLHVAAPEDIDIDKPLIDLGGYSCRWLGVENFMVAPGAALGYVQMELFNVFLM